MRCLGRILPAWFIVIGYIGPRRKPMKETEIPEARREGTSQIMRSKLEK
jgi:hypothetical protein